MTDSSREFLLEEGTDQRYGARHLKRAIERYLVSPLARLLVPSNCGRVISFSSIGILPKEVPLSSRMRRSNTLSMRRRILRRRSQWNSLLRKRESQFFLVFSSYAQVSVDCSSRLPDNLVA
jgi:hypothetical protein